MKHLFLSCLALLLVHFACSQDMFSEEDFVVTHTTPSGSQVSLAGTLTIPLSASSLPFPAVILVSGSGQQDRDGTLFGHKPFRTIAHYLAERGIASLRYDDRGVGGSLCSDSKSDVEMATSFDFADDAELLFQHLRLHPAIDSLHVGFIGHSEGGAIAPIVAARNAQVAFVVMLAGQGCTGADVLLQQNQAIFAGMGYADSLVALRVEFMRRCLEATALFPASQYDSVFKATANDLAGHLPKKQRRSIGLLGGDAFILARQIQIPWMQTFIRLDPADYLGKVRCPILALNGDRDCQVIASPNLEAIGRLTGGHAQTHLLPDLNHLFQHCTTGMTDEYASISEDFDDATLKLIADWILASLR